MSKITKVWLILATLLIVAGSILFVGVMINMKFDFNKLSTVEYETNSYEFNDEIKDISIKANTAEIKFLPSEDNTVRVVCREEVKEKHEVNVTNGNLEIKLKKMKKWYDYIGINLETPDITVYLPSGEYGAFNISTDTGDISISKDFAFESASVKASTADISFNCSVANTIKIEVDTGDVSLNSINAGDIILSSSTGKWKLVNVECSGDIEIESDTGRITFDNVNCNDIALESNTGRVEWNKVIAKGKYNIETDTGKILFTDCDASELYVKTNTGDIKGNLLTEKIFITESNTGKINVPKSTKGGICEISTDTGDIMIEIKNEIK